MSAASMLAAARRSLGLSGRPNYVTEAYARRHGAEFLRAAWCQMSITYWAKASGNEAAVLPAGDRAYTVWHAQDGQRAGRWHAGTVANLKRFAKPGAVVFFDWGGTDQIGAIDHVGLIERVLDDGRVQTIEGNTGDACKRRVRDASVIAGFWNPAYGNDQEDEMTGDALYRAVWEQDRMPVPYGKPDNKEWQPKSVLVDHGVRLRAIEAKLDAQNAAIREMAAALAAKDPEIDVQALIDRIESAIGQITVRLTVPGEE